jgi:hypothetical protein
MMNDRWGFDADGVAFDRLIDGELTGADERALLSTLDACPDGWRRCALAFLEARALKQELSVIAKSSQRLNGTPVEINAAAGERGSRSSMHQQAGSERWRHFFTLATSLLIAFCLGIVVRGQWMQRVGVDRSGPLVVKGENSETNSASQRNENGGANADDAWQLATLTMNVLGADGQKQSEIELPLIEAETFDPSLLRSKPVAVPESVREALVQSGHTLEEERLLVPVYLQDGRRAIVAVDRAQVSTGITY